MDELTDFTAVLTRKQDIEMRIWHVVPRLPADLHDTGEVQAIDETGVDRIAVNHNYEKRPNYTYEAVKTTTLTDFKTGAVLDMHCSMKQPHDSKIGGQLVNRIPNKLTVLTADKGYDCWLLRQRLRAKGVNR